MDIFQRVCLCPLLLFLHRKVFCMPIHNISGTDMWLPPHHVIGTMQAMVAISVGIAVPVSLDPSWEDCLAYVSTQEVTTCTSVPDFIIPDLEGLTEQQVLQAKTLFSKYDSIFARGKGDLGCTALITHEIPLLDDVPVFQPY